MTRKDTQPSDLTGSELDEVEGGLFTGPSGTGKTLTATLLGARSPRPADRSGKVVASGGGNGI